MAGCVLSLNPVCRTHQSTGLPINTAFAPSAKALMTSVPLVMPPSTYTSTRPATARQMSGSTLGRKGVGQKRSGAGRNKIRTD